MKLSFIVVTYKRGPLLQQCIDSIVAQENLPVPYEIIVVDNGGDAEINPPTHPDIQFRLEKPAENLGATGGRNLGMRLARGEYLVTLDDDAIWSQPDAVASMCQIMDTDPKCGAISACSLDPDGNPIVIEQPHPDKDYILKVTQSIEVPYFYAMGLALRAQAIREVGGYPERYRIYMEEVDLSYRLLDHGYRIVFDPRIGVHHFKTNLGRPVAGARYWRNSAINKSRLAWRLLPQPYPLTIMVIWSLAALVKTRNLSVLVQVWREVWQERQLLASERNPIKRQTVAYIKSIGGRLLY